MCKNPEVYVWPGGGESGVRQAKHVGQACMCSHKDEIE